MEKENSTEAKFVAMKKCITDSTGQGILYSLKILKVETVRKFRDQNKDCTWLGQISQNFLKFSRLKEFANFRIKNKDCTWLGQIWMCFRLSGITFTMVNSSNVLVITIKPLNYVGALACMKTLG